MSIIKHSQQRVAVLIDTQNLYHSAKNLYHSKVNFKNVLDEAVAGRILVRATAYVTTTESGEEKAFFEALEKSGIETKSKNLQIFSGGAKKANWDIDLTIDAVKMASKVDAIVVVSGDGDFVPLVEYLQSHGVQTEAASFGRSTSSKLIESVDDFIDLDDDPKKFLMRMPGGRPRRGIRKPEGDFSPAAPADLLPEVSEEGSMVK